MEFTWTSVSQQWALLHDSNSNPIVKKQADTYWTAFKQSPNSLEISLSWFLSSNPSDKWFACLVIYQNLRENIQNIINSKSDFNKLKDIFFTQIIPNIQNCPPLVIERICFSLTILMLIGSVTFWFNSIDDILAFGKQSDINCYLCTVILSNSSNELNELLINKQLSLRVKENWIENVDKIRGFIEVILWNSKNINDKNLANKIQNQAIELAKTWIGFEFNILQWPKMTKVVVDCINSDNIEQISDLLSESISCSKSAKPEENCSSVNDVKDYLEKVNPTEIDSIRGLIWWISNGINNINQSTGSNNTSLGANTPRNDNDELINGWAKIFSCITENFIFWFFWKDATSVLLFELFLFFVSHGKRSISYKLFETINILKCFINTEYKFSNYSDADKLDFSTFLIKITQSIMLNSKLPSLHIDKGNLLSDVINLTEKENPSDNIMSSIDVTDISVSDYRNNSENALFDIFNIFVHNFGDDGVTFYIRSLIDLLRIGGIDIKSDQILTQTNNLLIIEAILFVIKSIIDSFVSVNISKQPLIDVVLFFHNTRVWNSEFILINYWLFLQQASQELSTDETLYYEMVNFLLTITSSMKRLSKWATSIILNIAEGAKVYSERICNWLNGFYQGNYNEWDEAIVNNIAEAICSCVGVMDDSHQMQGNLTEEKLFNVYTSIMIPATTRIQEWVTMANDKPQAQNIPREWMKNYGVHEKVIKHTFFLEDAGFLWKVFEFHFSTTFEFTKRIFDIFYSVSPEIINKITIIYLKTTSNFKGVYIENAYSSLDQLMQKSYRDNPENYHSWYVWFNIYACVLQSTTVSESKINETLNNFLLISRAICANLLTSSHNKQIEILDTFAQFFHNIYSKINYTLWYACNQSLCNVILWDSITWFIEGLRSISENNWINNILKAFTAFIAKENAGEIIKLCFDKIVNAVFSSIDHFNDFTLTQFGLFVKECLRIYESEFVGCWTLQILNNRDLYKMIEEKHIGVLCEYWKLNKRSDKIIRGVWKDVMNICKGMGQVDCFTHYDIQLSRMKILKKE